MQVGDRIRFVGGPWAGEPTIDQGGQIKDGAGDFWLIEEHGNKYCWPMTDAFNESQYLVLNDLGYELPECDGIEKET